MGNCYDRVRVSARVHSNFAHCSTPNRVVFALFTISFRISICKPMTGFNYADVLDL